MMRVVITLLAAAALCFGADAPNKLTKAEKKAGWKLLFDGKTLNGWEMYPATANTPAATWQVGDGVVFCEGEKRGWLGSADVYTDYELKVDFKAGAKINSGVFLRSPKPGGTASGSGYELQIWDFRPTYKTGSLVNAIEAEPTTILADQWNSYHITVQGDHFIVVLNGKKVLDGHDKKHASGLVGLQYNIGGGKIEFRNIKIRPM